MALNVPEYAGLFILSVILVAGVTSLDLTQTLLSNAGLDVGETMTGILMITLMLLTLTFAFTARRR